MDYQKTRDVATTEAFLFHFAYRNKIETIKRDLIILVPDVFMPEKQALFKSRYLHLGGRRFSRFTSPTRIQTFSRKPETRQVNSLTEAIELGVARRNKAFSLYIRNYVRNDIECLLVHFTVDNKIVLGVSVGEKDADGQDNLPYARKIRQEMEGVVSLKASSVMFETSASDSEAEFIGMKNYWEDRNDLRNDFTRHSSFHFDLEHKLYYFIYRHQLYRKFRDVKGKVVYAPNLSDYFTMADTQGQILNVVEFHGDHLAHRKVQHSHGIDAAKLTYLGYLLNKVLDQKQKNFAPAKVLRISIPSESEVEVIWIGHRDGVSNFTTYEGIRASEVVIEEAYSLDSIEDVKKLADEGFFIFGNSFFKEGNLEAYKKWLIRYEQDQLYKALLQDEDLAWESKAKFIVKQNGRYYKKVKTK